MAGYGIGIANFGPLIGHDGQIPGRMTFTGQNAATPTTTATRCVLRSRWPASSSVEPGVVTLTRFRSMDDIRTFAGDAIDSPVIEPRAAELLAHYDERALHYDSAVFHPE